MAPAVYRYGNRSATCFVTTRGRTVTVESRGKGIGSLCFTTAKEKPMSYPKNPSHSSPRHHHPTRLSSAAMSQAQVFVYRGTIDDPLTADTGRRYKEVQVGDFNGRRVGRTSTPARDRPTAPVPAPTKIASTSTSNRGSLSNLSTVLVVAGTTHPWFQRSIHIMQGTRRIKMTRPGGTRLRDLALSRPPIETAIETFVRTRLVTAALNSSLDASPARIVVAGLH